MNEPVWLDRKRIFGMPISFTRYRLYKNKFVHSQGFFSVNEGEILLYRIMDVELKVTLIDRLFGVGTVILYTGDVTDSRFEIQKVKNPREVLSMLNDTVDNERGRVGVKGKELYGISGTD